MNTCNGYIDMTTGRCLKCGKTAQTTEGLCKNQTKDPPPDKWKYCPSCGVWWEPDSESFGCWQCGYIREYN